MRKTVLDQYPEIIQQNSEQNSPQIVALASGYRIDNINNPAYKLSPKMQYGRILMKKNLITDSSPLGRDLSTLKNLGQPEPLSTRFTTNNGGLSTFQKPIISYKMHPKANENNYSNYIAKLNQEVDVPKPQLQKEIAKSPEKII